MSLIKRKKYPFHLVSFDTNLKKYLLGLIGEDWYLTQFINFSNPILNNTPTTPQ